MSHVAAIVSANWEARDPQDKGPADYGMREDTAYVVTGYAQTPEGRVATLVAEDGSICTVPTFLLVIEAS